MSKPIIAVLGSCSVDFTTYAPRLPSCGETIHGTKFSTSFGGKGANQCVASAKLGGNVCMIAKLGNDDWGPKYKEHLSKLGVDTSHVSISPNRCTGVAQICVADGGENQIVIVAGANGDLGTVDVVAAAEVVRSAAVLVAQLETPLQTTLHALTLNQGIRILNAAPARVLNEIGDLLPHCSVLCVNESEASLVTGLTVTDVRSGVKALMRLLDCGCETVIITLGKDGALYATGPERRPTHVLSEPVTAVDTTGAGDAFIGALATFLATDKDKALHQVIGAACSVAAESVTRLGTQTSFSTRSDLFHKQYTYNFVE